MTEAATTTETAACAACEAPLHGRYCSACGQDNSGQRDLGFLARDAFAEALSLEGRTVHTLRDLLWRPGRLLSAWRSGAGDYYFSPFKLFLVATAALFLFLSWSNVAIYQFLPFRTADRIQVQLIENGVKVTGIEYRDAFFLPRDETPVVPALEAQLDAAAAAAAPTQRQAIADYRAYNAAWIEMNAFWTDWMPRILWGLIPAYAALLIVFFPRRRFAEHMLFTIWAHSAAAAVFMALAIVNLFGVGLSSMLIFPAVLALFTPAASRFYGTPMWQAALRGAGHLALYAVAVTLVLLSVAMIYAWDKVDFEMWLGESYVLVDGGAEVRAAPPGPAAE